MQAGLCGKWEPSFHCSQVRAYAPFCVCQLLVCVVRWAPLHELLEQTDCLMSNHKSSCSPTTSPHTAFACSPLPLPIPISTPKCPSRLHGQLWRPQGLSARRWCARPHSSLRLWLPAGRS